MTLYTQPYNLSACSTAYASSVNKLFGDFYTWQTADINSANVSTSGVDTVNLNNQSVTIDKIDHQTAYFVRTVRR